MTKHKNKRATDEKELKWCSELYDLMNRGGDDGVRGIGAMMIEAVAKLVRRRGCPKCGDTGITR